MIWPWLTHDELKQSFAALLKLDFPEQGKASGKRRRPAGRAGGVAPHKQVLKALGIYRLLKEHKAGEVLAFLEKQEHPLRHSEESALNRLRAQAQKAIGKFERDAISHMDNALIRKRALLTAALHSSMKHFPQM
jgi:hypothetical protein